MRALSGPTLAEVSIALLLNDRVMLIFLHGVLVTLLLMALFGTVVARWRKARGAVTLTVTRGASSMTILYVTYGVGTVALTLAVQVAQTALGYKVAIITFDYIALSYLFFFNSWFRNLLLHLLGRVYED